MYRLLRNDDLKNPLLVITGGEPLLQLAGVQELLLQLNMTYRKLGENRPLACIETSLAPAVYIEQLSKTPLCNASWKIGSPHSLEQLSSAADAMLEYGVSLDELKLVIVPEIEQMIALIQEHKALGFIAHKYLQPEWGRWEDMEYRRYCVSLVKKTGWRLSLQAHKLLGIR